MSDQENRQTVLLQALLPLLTPKQREVLVRSAAAMYISGEPAEDPAPAEEATPEQSADQQPA